jgi:hypothetical protein
MAIIIGSLNLWYLYPKPERLILVTYQQKACLNSWVGIENEYPIYGPEIFEEHSLVSVKKHFSDKFESDLAACFYDSHTESVNYRKIPDSAHLLKNTGSAQVYFYKSINSEEVVIYGKSN